MQPLQYDLRSPAAKDNSILPMQPQHEATLTQPFTLRERSYSCKAQWNSIGNSSTSNTCNPIYIAGTILELQITMEFHRQLIHQHHLQSHLQCGERFLQLQITMEFCRPHMHEKQVKPHLQCGTDPRMIRP